MIDFKELPQDGIRFEQVIRDLLVLEGFEVHWTGVGPDHGRDLIVVEKLSGKLSEYKKKWLISCKHTAHSGKSVGRDQAGNITEDCNAIKAEGYILACSTQPSSSLVTRLEEIAKSQNITTIFWDSIEIEKRLLQPNTFRLIHTFFPESSKNYKWNIYNSHSPAFWAANYKDYFLYLSSRHSNVYPNLKNIEEIVSLIEKVPIYKSDEDWTDSQYLRIRAVYYDDKHSTHIVYADYILPKKCQKEDILTPVQLESLLKEAFFKVDTKDMNLPTWDIKYIYESTVSDSFELDHKKYYKPYLDKFEKGNERSVFLDDMVHSL